MIENSFDEGFRVAWEVSCEAKVQPAVARAAGFRGLTSSQLAELVKLEASELTAGDLSELLTIAKAHRDAATGGEFAETVELIQTRLKRGESPKSQG